MEICIFLFTLISLIISVVLMINLKAFMHSYAWHEKQRTITREAFDNRHAEMKDYAKLILKEISKLEQNTYSMTYEQQKKTSKKEKKQK